MKPQVNPQEHSPIGGSVAHRFIKCPAAPAKSKGLDENNIHADTGSFAHFVAQQILIHAIATVTPEAVVNYEPVFNAQPDRDTPPKEYVPGMYGKQAEEIAEHVQKYVDTVRSFVTNPTDSFQVEQKVTLDWLHPDLRGMVDANVSKPTKKGIIVTDFKFGYTVVEVEDNEQLKYYALGAIGEGNPKGIEQVSLCIVQPRAIHSNGPVRFWEISADELIKWGNGVLAPAAHATDDPDAPIRVGPWCKYCPANTRTCQGVTDMALSLPVTGPVKMNEELLVKALEFDRLYDPWIKKIRAGALQIIKNGGTVPGFKGVLSTTKRRWANESAALGQLLCFHGDVVLKPPEQKLKSFTNLEKELPEESLEGLLEKPLGSLILVPKDDSRKEVVIRPGSVFDEVAKPSAVQQMTDDYKKKESSSGVTKGANK